MGSNGYVVQRGAALGMPTTVNRMTWTLVRLSQRGTQGLSHGERAAPRPHAVQQRAQRHQAPSAQRRNGLDRTDAEAHLDQGACQFTASAAPGKPGPGPAHRGLPDNAVPTLFSSTDPA